MATLLNGYDIVIASDIESRDGIGIEVWQGEECILEIFRDDANKEYSVSLFKNNVPLDLIEASISYFKKEIPLRFDD